MDDETTRLRALLERAEARVAELESIIAGRTTPPTRAELTAALATVTAERDALRAERDAARAAALEECAARCEAIYTERDDAARKRRTHGSRATRDEDCVRLQGQAQGAAMCAEALREGGE